MRQDEAAADSALRPGLAGSEAAADAEDEAGEDDADLLDTSDPAGGGESAASPEELEDEDAEGGGAARRRGSKTCTYEGCRETTSQVAKQRKPWMCKKHRNKMYKDKYKKKKSDQAQGSGGPAAASTGNVKLEESTENILSIVKQRTGSFGDRPARPTLLEQVLNQKRLVPGCRGALAHYRHHPGSMESQAPRPRTTGASRVPTPAAWQRLPVRAVPRVPPRTPVVRVAAGPAGRRRDRDSGSRGVSQAGASSSAAR
ncbi:similar to regulatory factor X-associated protein, partial [Rattus norvegicus]